MRYGTDTLSIIEQHLSAARDQTQAAGTRLEALNRRLLDLRADLGEAVRRLARFRMDELSAARVIAHLDETDREVVDLLSQRTEALRETEDNLAQSLEHQQALKASRDEAARVYDETLKALDDEAGEIRAQLDRQESYSTQETRTAEAAERLSRAREKADQAEADRAAKGEPYEKDPLFMYLWKRRFRTPEYKAGPLTRTLDAWVARMIRFDEARNNYAMLTQLPGHLQAHAERQEAVAAEEERKLRQMEAKALEDAGFAGRRETLDARQKALEALEIQIEEEEKNYERLMAARADFSSGADPFSSKAMALQVDEIANDSIAELYMEAKLTAKTDDDMIVQRIRDLQEEEKSITEELKQVQVEAARGQQGFRELETLRRRFRQNRYDSGHSYFPGSFDIGALLGMLLGGMASSGDVWERIRREQQFRRPRTPETFGGGFLPNLGRGIRHGGGFGGGGFRTGGGFGGGGFRTGGKF